MAGRFINKLKKAARLEPVKKVVLDGSEEVLLMCHPAHCNRTRTPRKMPLR